MTARGRAGAHSHKEIERWLSLVVVRPITGEWCVVF
jgi:hypothetical protein